MASAQPKDEFRNETKGFIGVITLDPTGKEKGVAVRPGSSIWLSEAEQILTANAPRLDKDNPFTNGQLSLVTKAADVKNRRPIGDAAPPASGEAPSTEEVAPESATPPPAAPDAGPEGNTAPKAETAEERAVKDRERVEAEKTKAAAAQKQAAAGAKPVTGPPAEPTRSGTPRPTQQPQEVAAK
jgi:hypothetical protein